MRTTLYAVYWAAEGVLKVGRTRQDRRWREMCATGGKVVLLSSEVAMELGCSVYGDEWLRMRAREMFDNEGATA